jgi:hypothetical protein
MDKGIQRAFRERYPELRFVEREVDVVEQTTRVRSQLPGEVVRRKVVKIMHDRYGVGPMEQALGAQERNRERRAGGHAPCKLHGSGAPDKDG